MFVCSLWIAGCRLFITSHKQGSTFPFQIAVAKVCVAKIEARAGRLYHWVKDTATEQTTEATGTACICSAYYTSE